MPDLFELFKKNESKLHEPPPDRLWKQLELRLEQSRKQRRKRPEIRFLQLGAVALILLILILAAVLLWHFAKKDAQSRSVSPSQPVEWRFSGVGYRVSGAAHEIRNTIPEKRIPYSCRSVFTGLTMDARSDS